ncbi:hypothetical protein RSSM_01277 [Rhodopirellula sallentina SM41]|uniref:LamG-like jellyroll fold domain-containing protein n=1 Tax=Rhodopirellula sallentina SM41 TaxID=1263870 RepID=M5U785_9BACT|nr:hypothetical protein RSSM_01277 [Rhodopirellula sallentina SM41]
MTPDNPNLSELRGLILKSQQELLTKEDIRRVNEIARTEAGSREAVALIDQFCALSDHNSLESPAIVKEVFEALREQPESTAAGAATASAPHVEVARKERAASHRPTTRNSGENRHYAWLLALVASNILVASFAWSLAKSQSGFDRVASSDLLQTNTPDRDSDAASQSVAPQLVSMTACVWRSTRETTPTIGDPIDSGEVLNLVEGIAELRLGENTGRDALVRIEGPASVHNQSNGELGLLRGSMTLKGIGANTEDNSVSIAAGRVTIGPQSFVGLVSDDTSSELHVFRGNAVLTPHDLNDELHEIRLEEGEAVRVFQQTDEGIQLVRFDASVGNFVSARSPNFDPLNLDDEYANTIQQSAPKVYWRFEQLKGDFPFYVENEGTAEGMNALIIGNPTWRQYGENRVAEIGTPTAAAFHAEEQWPPSALDEYSIELWVKPQLYHHGELLCLHDPLVLKDGRYQHTMMLEVTAKHYFTHRLSESEPNRIRFVHRALGETQPISATNIFSETTYEARMWQHVVAQKKDNSQRLWLNGQIVAERQNPVPLNANVQLLVGRVYPDSEYRRFVGQIDEVAVYDRAITKDEIQRHIEAAGRSVADASESVSEDQTPETTPAT